MSGDIEYDPTKHFFCVSRSDKAYGNVKEWGYFADFEEARTDACKNKRQYPFVWLMERGAALGRADDWMIFWWSDNLAEMPDYPHQREHYGRAYFEEETEGLTALEHNRMHDYVPLDPNWPKRHNADRFIKVTG